MKIEIICKRCGISKKSYQLLPRNCDFKGGFEIKHLWGKENVCSCGHGETSHYRNKAGLIQCSVGDCFPFNHNGHNVSFSKEKYEQNNTNN